jgi:hypothetical protein
VSIPGTRQEIVKQAQPRRSQSHSAEEVEPLRSLHGAVESIQDSSPSPDCRVCGRQSVPWSYLCRSCRRLRDRVEQQKDATSRGRKVNIGARRKALYDQWDSEIGAFRCYYTHIPLTDEQGSPRYATWEHRNPSDETSVVLVANIISRMKSDLTENQFRAMVAALSRHFDDSEPFDESAFPS